MLTQIDVECDNPFSLPVLGARPRDSLILQSFTGLGPPDKSLFVGDYSRDGGVYSGRRVLTRNPVLTIEINPNYSLGETVDGWRDILYRTFNDPFITGDDVTLVLKDDVKADRLLTGYCEKFDGETFSEDNAVQISMICPDPFIRDVVAKAITPPDGVEGWQTVPFLYAGTAEAGFEVTIEVQATTSTLTLDNNGRTMVLTYPSFQAGDIVYVNTKPGERAIKLWPAGTPTTDPGLEILYALYSGSPWLSLHSQSNNLQIYGDATTSFVASITSLNFTQLWWGA